jgi:succinyl-CoA synthetase beta subunit
MMKLYEYEAKQILSGAGIPVPRGALAKTPEQVREIVEKLKSPVMLKPQTLVKARGKAGLIKVADGPQEAAELSPSLFGREHAGEVIDTILVEEKINLIGELFLGIAVDYAGYMPVFLISPNGGVEIETLVREKPDRVRRFPVPVSQGMTEKEALTLARFIGERRTEMNNGKHLAELQRIILCFYQVFWNYDCELAEINPLGIRDDFSLIALDGNMAIDEESQFRHPELIRPRAQTEENARQEQDFRTRGWTYLQMDGDIGILSSGAGITMAIMDLIHLGGGKPANFLDTAQMNRQGIYDAFQIFHGSAKIKVLLVNIFAGLNRCDELALGIRDYLNAFRPSFPIVVRMIGNRENEGREILKEIGITPIAGLEESVDRAIALVR